MRYSRWVLAASVSLTVAACGGSDEGGGTGTCRPSGSASMTLTSSGVTPRAVCVLPGGTVVFVNSDAVQHDIVGDGGCTALDLGAIAPAATKVATFSATEQICSFHDAANATNAAFQGTVAVTSGPATGPGY